MTSSPYVDDGCLAVIAAVPVIAVGASLSEATLPAIREAVASLPAPSLSEEVARTDHHVPGSGVVVVRVHRPVGVDADLPCVYWMHGGGFVAGSRQQEDLRFDRWCRSHRCVGVAVEYRLAPETPFPGGLDDCIAGLRWIHANAAALGIDAGRIGIGGASAGGGLAAALALRARDQGGPPIAFQVLLYPMIDDRQVTGSSQWAAPVWPASANASAWTAYLGEAKGGPLVSPYAAAARATDLTRLPPTLVVVGSADGFVDEDVDYASRLVRAGVECELHVYAGATHSFDGFPGVAVARRATRDIDEWLTAQLERGGRG